MTEKLCAAAIVIITIWRGAWELRRGSYDDRDSCSDCFSGDAALHEKTLLPESNLYQCTGSDIGVASASENRTGFAADETKHCSFCSAGSAGSAAALFGEELSSAAVSIERTGFFCYNEWVTF